MINMDMIGRIRDGKVYVNGTGTGSTLDERWSRKSSRRRDSTSIFPKRLGYGGSDHMSFTIKSVPVLFFFSGLHGDYHKPSDTADKIDAADAAKLLDYVARGSRCVSKTPPDRPQFVRLAQPQEPASGSRQQQRLRLRAEFRQHPGFRRAAQGRAFRRCPRRHSGRQGGA